MNIKECHLLGRPVQIGNTIHKDLSLFKDIPYETKTLLTNLYWRYEDTITTPLRTSIDTGLFLTTTESLQGDF